jgi:hypothetical protein
MDRIKYSTVYLASTVQSRPHLHCTKKFLYSQNNKRQGLVPNSYIHVSVSDLYITSNVTLPHWGGGGAVRLINITALLPHPPLSSAEGVDSEGENERGPSQRGRNKKGGVGGGESVGAESEG